MDALANPGLLLPLLITVTVALSYLANYYLVRLIPWKWYRVLVGPGIIVHEYAHAAGCALTGARIRQITVFEATGGRVVHEAPRLPFGQAIITLAPLLAAAGLTYGFFRLLVEDSRLLSPAGVLFGYLAAALTVTMAPSQQDLKVGMAALAGLSLFLGLASLSEPASSYGEALFGDAVTTVARAIMFSLVILLAITGLAMVAYLVRRPKRRPKPIE